MECHLCKSASHLFDKRQIWFAILRKFCKGQFLLRASATPFTIKHPSRNLSTSSVPETSLSNEANRMSASVGLNSKAFRQASNRTPAPKPLSFPLLPSPGPPVLTTANISCISRAYTLTLKAKCRMQMGTSPKNSQGNMPHANGPFAQGCRMQKGPLAKDTQGKMPNVNGHLTTHPRTQSHRPQSHRTQSHRSQSRRSQSLEPPLPEPPLPETNWSLRSQSLRRRRCRGLQGSSRVPRSRAAATPQERRALATLSQTSVPAALAADLP